MLHRVLAVALAVGLLAGLAVAVLQHFATTPMILAAEAYEESAAPAAPHDHHAHATGAAHSHASNAHDHTSDAQESWKPADGLQRTLFTSLATVATAVGFSLVLLAGMLAANDRIDARTAVAWGAAAFAATGLAPALGLAPELPGSAAGPLLARQVWWLATAVSTGLAIWLFLRAKTLIVKLIGVPLLLLPHIIGAPRPAHFGAKMPAELAAGFASASLLTQAMLWILSGLAAGVLWGHIFTNEQDQS